MLYARNRDIDAIAEEEAYQAEIDLDSSQTFLNPTN
jgi:hypothetical protein